ncbi:Flp family type IVb pilin [bacterium]|nr:MAG: Flp family type IVb pilin [bacterium]
MVHVVSSLLRDEGGTTMVEYGILLGFIAIVALVGVQTFGQAVRALFISDAGAL